ncbi:MAG TPA: hypothetical protein VLH08_22760 [Acidobacteriota bacterium]|nr:hypothetical protein [Acidobacteriota bacterium]
MQLTENEFVNQFESATLPAENFHHAEHVRIAWIYLRDYPRIEALNRFCKYLKQFAAAQGHQNRYHETITWAYFLLIQQRREKNKNACWEIFVKENQDLMDWQNSVLKKYYKDETLKSEVARSIFLFPDRLSIS